jgi:hypothetical protein
MEFRTKNGLLLSSGLESGLSPLKIRENNYIVYAAGVNQAAMIKKDEIMSVFTKALYDEMDLDGNFEKSLEELIKSTRKKVISVTEGQQLPWTSSSLSEDYHLYSDFIYNIRYYIQRKILASRKNKKS